MAGPRHYRPHRVAQYLRENRIVEEKNDLTRVVFLLTPGVEDSKAATLISGLVAFKKRTTTTRCWRGDPNSTSAQSERYAGVRAGYVRRHARLSAKKVRVLQASNSCKST